MAAAMVSNLARAIECPQQPLVNTWSQSPAEALDSLCSSDCFGCKRLFDFVKSDRSGGCGEEKY